jgi:hypothetical protein
MPTDMPLQQQEEIESALVDLLLRDFATITTYCRTELAHLFDAPRDRFTAADELKPPINMC